MLGKKDFVFSKPFEFPFKVSDLIYMISYSDFFCFIDSPDKIQRELSQINSKNLKFENCSKDSNINVCFIQGSGCDIFVNYDSNYVEKKNTRMYFEGDALMYAGIFSEPELYECQVKRLMKKVEILSKIYLDKSSFIAREGCSSNLETELIGIGSAAGSLENSFGLKLVSIIAEEAGKKNYANVECRLW